MALHAVHKVQIDDSEFKTFAKKFARYQEQLKSSKAAWVEAAEAIAGAGNSMGHANDNAGELSEDADHARRRYREGSRLLQTFTSTWTGIRGRTRQMAADIGHATLQLVKWSALTSVFSGLVGAGGLWGLNRMAEGVSARRSSALGVGASYGQHAAFTSVFERLGNPEQILHGFANAITDVRKRGPLVGLVGAEKADRISKLGPAEAFVEAIPEIMDLINRTDAAILGPVLRSRGLDQLGIDVRLARVLKELGPAEIADLLKRYREERKPLDIPKQAARDYSDLVSHLDMAWLKIEAVIAKGLVGLTPTLEKISQAFVHIFENFLGPGGPAEKWIGIAADYIQKFGNWLKSPEFDASVESFMSFVKQVGELINRWTNAPSNDEPRHRKLNRYWRYFQKTAFGGGDGGGSSGGNTSADDDGDGSDRTSDGRPVPPGLLAKAAGLLRNGKNSADLKAFMSSQGYPMSGAWCGQFAASVVRAGGGAPPKGAAVASNWLRWGQHVDPKDARPGDIAVQKYSRFGGMAVPGRPGSHVGFISSINPETGRFDMLGGNQRRAIGNRMIRQFEFRRPREIIEGPGVSQAAPPSSVPSILRDRTDRRAIRRGPQHDEQQPAIRAHHPSAAGVSTGLVIENNSGGVVNVNAPSISRGRFNVPESPVVRMLGR